MKYLRIEKISHGEVSISPNPHTAILTYTIKLKKNKIKYNTTVQIKPNFFFIASLVSIHF